MNIQRYSSIYAAYHSTTYPDVDNDKIIIPFADMSCDRINLLRLKRFDKIICPEKNPFLDALKTFYKTESICTVFLDKDTVSILIGNERIVYPQSDNGTCKLVATPYFVKDPAVFDNYLKGHARMIHENVYTYKNSIIYLDQFDIPGPGKKYFEDSKANSLYRICYITSNVRETNTTEWQNRKEILYIPFKTKPVSCLPHFIHYNPVNELTIPDSHITGTGNIKKKLCYKNKNFLLQDILNSYPGEINHLGLLIEYPFCISFDGACDPTNRFVPLTVNGNHPKKVLVVKRNYDRYFEYDVVPAAQYSQILYEKQPKSVLDRVIIKGTMVGFIYNDIFLCLSHPLINNSIYQLNLNTNHLCKVNEKYDLSKDPNITILDTYQYDCKHTLNRLKYKGISYELWCLSVHSDSKSFPKRYKPPHLVDHYLNFYTKNCNKSKLDFTNLDVVKLAFVLSKHKICFKIKITNGKRQIEMDNENLIFRIDEEAAKFLNDIRLDYKSTKETEQIKKDCNIM